ncbi:MAG: polyphosphate kinase 2 family protein [Candidatus Obscuribacterales bacterium]|jgi:PPK2 family polyphosphate:nucleotide phosphotransferase|nr:polyphosphate kinase 2 family protein [Candidatus Obscuribacterales bacterium]
MKIPGLTDKLLVKPGSKVSLSKKYRPDYIPDGMTKEKAAEKLQDSIKLLTEYQDKLYAQDSQSLLIILQAIDAAGKDGTIKHVMSGLNPQGCHVVSFKAPSTEELGHDYLWRCSKALPERGMIGIFNRSYYEEVLVARVHPEILAKQKLPSRLVDKKIWQRRFKEINNFEEYLVNNGTTVLKFYLNISKQEQKERFLRRIERPEKNWKFEMGDVEERAHWQDYIDAYEECLSATSTERAPWYVIPADFKPFTRLAVSYVIYETLKKLNLKYPVLGAEQKKMLAQAKKKLELE